MRIRSAAKSFASLAALGFACFVAAAGAQEPIAMPAAPTPAPAATEPATTEPAAAVATAKPNRGATMSAVREKFGAPSQEAPAVGQPPITRWEYPGYVVFFENDRVLHTVVLK
jgi:hypothetical protein